MIWPKHYCCMTCAGPAAIRIFSGTSIGAAASGGWPACWAHVADAETRALAQLRTSTTPVGWKVSAHRVEIDEEGWPVLGALLWEAKRT
jgi:hypothetical protein